MKRWALVGGIACFAAACGGAVVELRSSGDGGQGSENGGGSGSSGNGAANSGTSASSDGGTNSGGGTSIGAGGGGGSSGPSNEVAADAEGDALDEATVVEEDGATVTGVAYGNPVKFPACIGGNGLIQAGYLFAAPVDLPSAGTVQGLGLITEQSTVATLALYALAPAGLLGLVTKTASTSVAAGSNVMPTPPTALPGAGNSYWVAVEFEETTTVCADGWGAQIQLSMEPYGVFPSIWSPTAITTSSQLNFFVVIN